MPTLNYGSKLLELSNKLNVTRTEQMKLDILQLSIKCIHVTSCVYYNLNRLSMSYSYVTKFPQNFVFSTAEPLQCNDADNDFS